MQDLSINQYANRQATCSSTPTHYADVLSVHLSDQKGNEQPERNRRKGRNNKWGGNRKDNRNDDKNMYNARGTRILS